MEKGYPANNVIAEKINKQYQTAKGGSINVGDTATVDGKLYMYLPGEDGSYQWHVVQARGWLNGHAFDDSAKNDFTNAMTKLGLGYYERQ